MSVVEDDGLVRFTVKELLEKLDHKLDFIATQLSQKADQTDLLALEVRLSAVERASASEQTLAAYRDDLAVERKRDRRWYLGIIMTVIIAATTMTLTIVRNAEGASGISTAVSVIRHDSFPLRYRSAGPRVCDAQWLLMGKRPSVYRDRRFVKLTPGRPSCYYGLRTVRATRALRSELGFPAGSLDAGWTLYLKEVVTGEKKRPLSYVQRAADRQASEVAAAKAKLDTYAARVVRVARGQIGCRETSWNYAACIAKFQAVTGAYRAPWCVSFAQWVYVQAGLGTFANRSAGVFYVRDYGRARGWLRAVPKPGYLVAFGDRLGHMAIVESVGNGSYTTIEGNASDQVLRRVHPLRSSRPQVYVEVPGILAQVPATVKENR